MNLPENTIRWVRDGDEWGLFVGDPPVLVAGTIMGGLVAITKKDSSMTSGELEIAYRQLRQHLHARPRVDALYMCRESVRKMGLVAIEMQAEIERG